jgi:hypothetical protein
MAGKIDTSAVRRTDDERLREENIANGHGYIRLTHVKLSL